MGKGDRKTTKGKRVMGSYGNTRKRSSGKTTVTAAAAKPASEPKAEKAPAKKPAAKKAPAAKKTTKTAKAEKAEE